MPGSAYTGDENELKSRITGLGVEYSVYVRRREEEERVRSYTSQLALVTTKEAAVVVKAEIQVEIKNIVRGKLNYI